MINYKIDILSALKAKGYSSYHIRQNKTFSESTLQKIRRGEVVNGANLNLLCRLLDCQPGDILEYIPDANSKRIE